MESRFWPHRIPHRSTLSWRSCGPVSVSTAGCSVIVCNVKPYLFENASFNFPLASFPLLPLCSFLYHHIFFRCPGPFGWWDLFLYIFLSNSFSFSIVKSVVFIYIYKKSQDTALRGSLQHVGVTRAKVLQNYIPAAIEFNFFLKLKPAALLWWILKPWLCVLSFLKPESFQSITAHQICCHRCWRRQVAWEWISWWTLEVKKSQFIL